MLFAPLTRHIGRMESGYILRHLEGDSALFGAHLDPLKRSSGVTSALPKSNSLLSSSRRE